jgi:AraC-like DNA-binding protein
MKATTKHILSLFHTPSPAAREIFYCVVRAGWVHTAPDYRIERNCCSGHELLYCLNGAGFVRSHGRTHAVEKGCMAWIDGYHRHAHWAHQGRPWELYWLRMDSPLLDATCRLLEANRRPVIRPLTQQVMIAGAYKRIFNLLARRPIAMEALVHAEVAGLIARLFQARQAGLADEGVIGQSDESPELLIPIQQMSLYPHRSWRLAELARMANVSVPHFCRQFRQVFHASPIDWLRRERITRTKRRLLESADSIQEIAAQVGYRDPFFFSRDFKRYTGLSPTQFRQQEIGPCSIRRING